jgi:hypothetical protein
MLGWNTILRLKFHLEGLYEKKRPITMSKSERTKLAKTSHPTTELVVSLQINDEECLLILEISLTFIRLWFI